MGIGFRLHRGVIAPSLAQYAVIVGNGAAFSFIPLLGISRGVANPGLYFTAVAISSIVARLLTGRIADRRGRFTAIVPGMIVTAAGMYIVSSAASVEAFVFAGMAVGIGFATAQPALQALAIDLAERPSAAPRWRRSGPSPTSASSPARSSQARSPPLPGSAPFSSSPL